MLQRGDEEACNNALYRLAVVHQVCVVGGLTEVSDMAN